MSTAIDRESMHIRLIPTPSHNMPSEIEGFFSAGRALKESMYEL